MESKQDFIPASYLSLAHLTLLSDLLYECWSSSCSLQRVFGLAVAPLWHALWYEWEGAARTRGGAAATVGVMGLVGTDWLISHTHSPGNKSPEGAAVLEGCAFLCVRVCECETTRWWVGKELWEIQNPQIAEFGCHDPTPTPISCLNCLSMSWAPFHTTAAALVHIRWTHVGVHTVSVITGK